MPHKYVEKQVLDRLREEIAKRDTEISRIRSIARKDKDGIEAFLDRMRKLLDSARSKKNNAMDMLMEDGQARRAPSGEIIPAPLLSAEIQERMALIFRGEEKAFEAVLEMFENPDAAVDMFVQDRNQLLEQLKQYEKYEQRENTASDER